MQVSSKLNILGLSIFDKIGEGKSGSVFSTSDKKYVVKIVYFDDDTAFDKEVKVGKMVKKEYGAKIRGNSFKFKKGTQRYNQLREVLIDTESMKKEEMPEYIGYYIMDNLELKRGEKAISLSDYIKDTCPTEDSPIYKKLRTTLESFYKLGFYHGDLHFNNIYVILENRKIKYVKLIDYGSSMEFEGNGKKNKCLEEYLENISNDFERKDERYVSPRISFLGGGRYHKDGSVVRSDLNMLKTNPMFLERLTSTIKELKETVANIEKKNKTKNSGSRFVVVNYDNNDNNWRLIN